MASSSVLNLNRGATGPEGFFARHRHVGCYVEQQCGFKEIAAHRLAANRDFCTLGNRIGNVLLHLFNRCLVDQRTSGNTSFDAVPHFQVLYGNCKLFSELVINAFLHQQAVGTHAGLARIAVF